MRRNRAILLAVLVAITPVLSACENFDMDKLDVFGLNEKKKLPGDRKPLFPEGVPGVMQGVPKEYMKGYQEQQQKEDAARAAAEAEAAEKAKLAALEAEKQKPKRKKPRAVVLRGEPAQITVQPRQQQSQPQAQQGGQQQAPWPEPQRPAGQ